MDIRKAMTGCTVHRRRMGTMIQNAGLKRVTTWVYNILHPEIIKSIHRACGGRADNNHQHLWNQ